MKSNIYSVYYYVVSSGPGNVPRALKSKRYKARGASMSAVAAESSLSLVTKPACRDRTAYLSLLVQHNRSTGPKDSTFLARQGASKGIAVQLKLLLALVRSLRRVEQCRRDFVLLLGTGVPTLPAAVWKPLADEGVIQHATAPLITGVPSADKLEAWRLLQYSKIAVLDADMLVLESLDDLLRRPEDFTIAQHPYDLVQGRCGIPPARRGVGAFFILRPNEMDFSSLGMYLRSHDAWHLKHFSEQTALNCFFMNRSVTLPCNAIYDVGVSSHTRGSLQHKNCVKFSGFGRKACDGVADRVANQCLWNDVRRKALAVHFKGSKKPWRFDHRCASLTEGPLRLANRSIALSPHDDLIWDQAHHACMTRELRKRASYAHGGAVTRACCSASTLLQAAWHQMLGSYNVRASDIAIASQR